MTSEVANDGGRKSRGLVFCPGGYRGEWKECYDYQRAVA